MTTTPTLLVPDLSEWQGTVDWATLSRGYPAAIIRAYNGSRVDRQFQHNRDQAHAHGIRALGLYAFLVPGDPAHQAAEFVATVGKLKPGEWPILDYEAVGLHPADIRTWVHDVGRALHGSEPWLYASESVYRSENLGAVTAIPAIRTWLAAWGPNEPSEHHELWQYTDHRVVAGVAGHVDCSEFHGTVDQLVHAVSPITTPPVKTPPLPPAPGPTSHPRYPYPKGIHPGGTSPSARPLQRALKATGWLDHAVAESDHYGPATCAAVGGFNDKHHLDAAGISHDPAIGPRGWALLMTLAYGAS